MPANDRSPEEIEELRRQFELQRRELEAENRRLQQYRDRYVDLYDSAPVGYATLDEDGYVQEINLTGARLLGAERDSLTGYPLADCVAKEDQEAFFDHVRQCLNGQREVTSELTLVAQGGRPFTAQLHSIPAKSVEGEADTHCRTAIIDISERRQMEETIRQSQAFLQTVIDSIPDPMLVIDRDHRTVLANRAAREMAGETDPVSRCLTCYWLAHQRDLPCADHNQPCPLQQVVASKASTTVMHTRPGVGGEETFIEVVAAPILNKAGDVAHIIETRRDVTERQREVEALREANRKLASTLESITDAFFSVDRNWTVTSVNAAAEKIWQKSRDEVLGRNLWELFPEAVGTRFDQEFHRALRDNVTVDLEEYYAPLALWAEVHVYPSAIGLAVYFRDVSDRKQAEGQLRRTAERVELLSTVASQLLASNQPEEIVDELCQKVMQHLDCDVFFNYLVADGDQRKLRLNHAGGIPPEVVKQIEHLDFGQALCGYSAAERRPVIVEHVLENTDPRTEPIRSLGIAAYACHPLISREQLIGTLSFGSRSKPAFTDDELALMRAVSDHVAVAIERTQLLKSIRQRAAEADAANRAKDHFLAVLSHELRTPLTPVVMAVSMLQERRDLDPDMRESLEIVHRNVEMEAKLIDDLLDVARIARGKIELTRSAVELCTVINRAVEVCKPDIEARGLHFGVDMGPSAPYWVEADVPRLQQVFWNLLKNAIKFTPHGGCVGIRCRPNEKYVLAEVNDSGMGIEPEALPRIFNAFEQVEQSVTRQFGGLGLGLAISKALVEMHGGNIEAHSEGRDKGATFRVRLPLTAPAGQPESPAPAAPRKRAVRPLHILLVEDHGVTAKMMQMVLTSDGHNVETAGDVATALELAGQRAFDLLLSDLGLPDGSGHDLIRQLRQRGHKFPGIALSGYGQEEDIRRSYQAGFVAHLTKPASREAVIEAIASVTAGEMPTAAIDSAVASESASHVESPVFDADAALR